MALEAEETELKLFNELMNIGCCKRCALRYLGHDKTLLIFEHPNTSLVNFGLLPPECEFEIEPCDKKMKENPCSVCLGLLQDNILDDLLTHPILTGTAEYQHKTFIPYITFPSCILLRDHSMQIHLKRFLNDAIDTTRFIKINNAWRYSIEKKLSQILKKKYDSNSKFVVHFYTKYILEDEEVKCIQNITNSAYNYDFTKPLSRHNIKSLLLEMSDDEFCKLITVPPKIPFYGLTLKDIKYFSEPIHFMGSYCKYSRGLSQSPHYNEEKCITIEESVEQIICDAVKSVNSTFKGITFKASSFDVQIQRVLGKGRTFQLTICDSKFDFLTKQECEKVEKIVRKTKIVEVKNFKPADRRDIVVIMDSEMMAPRSYKVLCLIYQCKNIDYCVNAVNMYTTLNVQQKTPLRLIHQRPYCDKRKKIYYLRAKKLKDNLMEIDICTQVGLYIDEFVNGDLGRTSPSLCDITKAKAEVLAIDLVDLQSTNACALEEEEVVI